MDIIGPYEVNIRPQERIGEGSFGYVCKARHMETGDLAAAKCITPKSGGFDWDRVQAELANILAASVPGHPSILNIIDHYEIEGTSKVLWIFTELCELKDMTNYVKIFDLQMRHKLHIMKQISSGLSYLHNHDPVIVHRDIKPANILFKNMGNYHMAMISDFGVSKIIESNTHLSTKTGTEAYKAPELFKDPRSPSVRYDIHGYVDIFACGITFYELLLCSIETGLDIKGISDLCIGVVMWKRRYERWSPVEILDDEPSIMKDVKELIDRMIYVVPHNRVPMNQVEEKLQTMIDSSPKYKKLTLPPPAPPKTSTDATATPRPGKPKIPPKPKINKDLKKREKEKDELKETETPKMSSASVLEAFT